MSQALAQASSESQGGDGTLGKGPTPASWDG